MPFCGWSAMGAVAWPYVALWVAMKLAMWALIATVVIFAIRRFRECRLAGMPTPLEILSRRYARGEITKQDFESMRRDLGA